MGTRMVGRTSRTGSEDRVRRIALRIGKERFSFHLSQRAGGSMNRGPPHSATECWVSHASHTRMHLQHTITCRVLVLRRSVEFQHPCHGCVKYMCVHASRTVRHEPTP